MSDPADSDRSKEAPRVERPSLSFRRGRHDPISKELASLAERREMLQRAAQRMLEEAERLQEQWERLAREHNRHP
jgi:hypothetical protein